MKRSRCVGIDVSADEIVVAIEERAGRLTLANDLEGHEHTRGFYQQRIARGLKPIQALVAIERKLLHAIHGMGSSNTDFEGSRFFAMEA